MEWIAVSIGIGLIVSLLFTELFGLTIGGMIVPGYLALYLDRPATVLLTFVAAFATWGCIALLSRWAILFGRRRVVITMVVGFAIASMIRAAMAATSGHPMESQGPDATVIGFVIPGLIALWLDRIGLVPALSPMIVATSLVRLVLVLLSIEAVI
jgi:poly-gamma-glutamate biosynthesis protein PgsC/CapC